MTDWQTYRNGNPRAIWDLERLSRHRAAKLGYRVHRSRRRTSSPQGSFVANLEFRRIKWWRRSSKSQKLIPWPQSDAPVHVAGDAYSIPASLGGWFLSIQSVLEKAREDHELQSE